MFTNDVETTYEYGADGRLLRAGEETFTYDDNGAMLTRQIGEQETINTWNHRQMLASVTSPDGVTTAYGYDHDGQRIRAGNRVFLVDSNREIPQVVEVRDLQGHLLAHFTYGLDGAPLKISLAGGYYYPLTDAQGNVTSITDAVGQVVKTYRYDAWGNITRETGQLETSYRYRGEEWEAGIGGYYLRARYYLPEYGRFMSRDPWQGTPAKPATGNPYIYANNNPITGKDPTGLYTLTEINAALTIGSNTRKYKLNYHLYQSRIHSTALLPGDRRRL